MQTGYCPIQSSDKPVIVRIVDRAIALRFGVPRKDRQHRQAEPGEGSHEILRGQLRLKIAFLVVEPARTKVAQAASRKRDMLREVFAHRNVIVCTVISVLLVAFLMVFYSFMPLVLITVRSFDKSTMSWLMATYGLSSIAYAVLVPGASDIVGRRPVTVIVAAVSTILPLAALFSNGPVWQLFALFALGSVISGIFPICMATIPAETVPPRLIATVMGVTMGAAEILGGVFGPMASGVIADRFGLRATLWVLVSLTIAMSLLALALTETAPRRIAVRAIA